MSRLALFCLVVVLVGCSVYDHRRCGAGRNLSFSEISYASTIFGNNLKYNEVCVFSDAIPEPFNFVGAYTRDRNIYIAPDQYHADFLRRSEELFHYDDLSVFIGELLKVWQFESGYASDLQQYISEHESYGANVGEYDVQDFSSLEFTDFRLEQQREIIVDFVYIRAFSDPQFETYRTLIRKTLPVDPEP